MTEINSAYVPGVCNINRAEIVQRRKLGHIGLAVFVVILAVLLLTDLDRLYRIVLALPAILAASGYLQARNHFCVGYAGAGQQNAEEGSTEARDITDQAARARDKSKARKMNLQSVGIGVLATLVAIALPHL